MLAPSTIPLTNPHATSGPPPAEGRPPDPMTESRVTGAMHATRQGAREWLAQMAESSVWAATGLMLWGASGLALLSASDESVGSEGAVFFAGGAGLLTLGGAALAMAVHRCVLRNSRLGPT